MHARTSQTYIHVHVHVQRIHVHVQRTCTTYIHTYMYNVHVHVHVQCTCNGGLLYCPCLGQFNSKNKIEAGINDMNAGGLPVFLPTYTHVHAHVCTMRLYTCGYTCTSTRCVLAYLSVHKPKVLTKVTCALKLHDIVTFGEYTENV